ncbi:MAG: polymerase sigma factor SigE [Verrucomicrobiota bacterium]|jgi:DNA-directed RNA polymerase specialized sigma24 family protein
MSKLSKAAAAGVDPYRTRATLLLRVNRKDEQSWADFYALYSPLIRWACRRRGLGDEHRQQLVVQAVMCHFAATDWAYDESKGRFRSLVLRVAELKIHEVLRETRSAGPLAIQDSYDEATLAAEDNPPPEDEDAQRLERLQMAFALLAQNPSINKLHLQVLHLVLQGVRSPGIAEQTGIPVKHVYVIKHRMVEALRQVLAGLESPE